MQLFMGALPGRGASKKTNGPEVESEEIALSMQVQKICEAHQEGLQ